MLYQELSGLAGSPVVRRVGKALRDSAGKSRGARGGGVASPRSENASLGAGSFPAARRGSYGNGFGGGFSALRRGFPARGQNQRGFGANNNRPPMRCFSCGLVGHGFQQCPEGNRNNRNDRNVPQQNMT